MTPMYFKSSFWLSLPRFHRALYPKLFATANANAAAIRRFASAFPAGEVFQDGSFTSRHFAGYPIWLDVIGEDRKTMKDVLEVGSFEGKSTVVLAWMFPNATITCIDPYEDYSEVDLSMNEVYAKFVKNTAPVADRVDLRRGCSSSEMPKLAEAGAQFDLIFIDGSHHADDVIVDSRLAWPLLKTGGVLIWDDYLWRRKQFDGANPKRAIDAFLDERAGDYEVLFAFKQVGVRKLA